MIPVDDDQFDDDAAFAAGVGFTDVVKRPTSNARQLRRAEFDYGRRLLAEKLDAVKPKVVIITFREAAERLFGKGTVPGITLAGADVFVMPGPYERSAASRAPPRRTRCDRAPRLTPAAAQLPDFGSGLVARAGTAIASRLVRSRRTTQCEIRPPRTARLIC
ncbi:MAG: hypothetical protein M3295_08430 [Chloroflexota bacterium]|nr:hypothetical protein [Chloroflexota bacterium]